MKDQSILIRCACHAEIMEVTKFDDETEYNLDIYRTWNPNRSIWQRIRIAFGYLFHAKQEVTSFCISNEDALLLHTFITDTQIKNAKRN